MAGGEPASVSEAVKRLIDRGLLVQGGKRSSAELLGVPADWPGPDHPFG